MIAHAIKEHPEYSKDVDHIFEEVKIASLDRPFRGLDDSSATMVPRPSAYSMFNSEKLSKIASNAKTKAEDDEAEDDAPLDLSRPSKRSDGEAPKAEQGPVSPPKIPNFLQAIPQPAEMNKEEMEIQGDTRLFHSLYR